MTILRSLDILNCIRHTETHIFFFMNDRLLEPHSPEFQFIEFQIIWYLLTIIIFSLNLKGCMNILQWCCTDLHLLCWQLLQHDFEIMQSKFELSKLQSHNNIRQATIIITIISPFGMSKYRLKQSHFNMQLGNVLNWNCDYWNASIQCDLSIATSRLSILYSLSIYI